VKISRLLRPSTGSLGAMGALQTANLIGAAMGAINIVLISRWIGPTEFGVFSIIAGTAQVARQLCDSRSADLLVRFTPTASAGAPSELGALTWMCALLDALATVAAMGLVWILGDVIARFVFHGASADLVRTGCLLLLASVGSATAYGLLAARGRFRTVAVCELATTGATLLLTMLVLPRSQTATTMVLVSAGATAVGTIARILAASHAIRRAHGPALLTLSTLRAVPTMFARTWRFALGTNLFATTKLLRSGLPGLFVASMLSVHEAGFYYLGERIAAKVNVLLTPVHRVLFPALTRARHELDQRAIASAVQQAALMACVVGLPFIVVFGVAGRFTVPLVFGEAYRPGVVVVAMCVTGAAIGAGILAVTGPLMMSADRMALLNLTFLAASLVELITLAAGLPILGVTAAGLGVLGFYATASGTTLLATLGSRDLPTTLRAGVKVEA
jgi:O-antigen/teichoic acid export membrane protein